MVAKINKWFLYETKNWQEMENNSIGMESLKGCFFWKYHCPNDVISRHEAFWSSCCSLPLQCLCLRYYELLVRGKRLAVTAEFVVYLSVLPLAPELTIIRITCHMCLHMNRLYKSVNLWLIIVHVTFVSGKWRIGFSDLSITQISLHI